MVGANFQLLDTARSIRPGVGEPGVRAGSRSWRDGSVPGQDRSLHCGRDDSGAVRCGSTVGYTRGVGDTTDPGYVQLGEMRIAYSVVRSRRRRRTIGITLADDGGVIVRAPLRTPRRVVEDLVLRKAAWIARRQAEARERPGPLQFVSGEEVPYLGEAKRLTLRRTDARQVALRFDGHSFEAHVPLTHDEEQATVAVRHAMEAWLRGRAQQLLDASVQRWAAAMRCDPGPVLVRNQKRQWGSCAQDGTLRFNWRLVMLEPSLIDYVVVHELLHIRVRNHSQDFWSAVAGVMPDFNERRKRLREAGAALAV